MTEEQREVLFIRLLADLPRTDPGDVHGTLLQLHDYVKIADHVTGAKVAQWNRDDLIGEPPRRIIVVDQSEDEVNALMRAWRKASA